MKIKALTEHFGECEIEFDYGIGGLSNFKVTKTIFTKDELSEIKDIAEEELMWDFEMQNKATW